jgi:hypothetical protein
VTSVHARLKPPEANYNDSALDGERGRYPVPIGALRINFQVAEILKGEARDLPFFIRDMAVVIAAFE